MKPVKITEADARQLNWLAMDKLYGTAALGWYNYPGFKNFWSNKGYHWPALASKQVRIHEDDGYLLNLMLSWGIEHFRTAEELWGFRHEDLEGVVFDTDPKIGILRTLVLLTYKQNDVLVPDELAEPYVS